MSLETKDAPALTGHFGEIIEHSALTAGLLVYEQNVATLDGAAQLLATRRQGGRGEVEIITTRFRERFVFQAEC